MKILYVRNKELFGYHKITAIKPEDFVFGSEELNEDIFGILSEDISDEEFEAWTNHNTYCVNNTKTGIKKTPDEYLIPDAVMPAEIIEEKREE